MFSNVFETEALLNIIDEDYWKIISKGGLKKKNQNYESQKGGGKWYEYSNKFNIFDVLKIFYHTKECSFKTRKKIYVFR